jgi:alpha-mannosidase
VRYSLLPHPGDWREAGVVQEAAAFNQPLLARVAHEDSALPRGQVSGSVWRPRISSGSVAIACLKPAHRGNGRVVRLYETGGRSALVRLSGLPPRSRVTETTVVEDELATLDVTDDGVNLHFRPWQVRTLLITGE